MEFVNQELTSTEVDTSNDIIVIEQKITKLQARFKQKRQKLEPQKSILLTNDILNASSKMSTCTIGNTRGALSILW